MHEPQPQKPEADEPTKPRHSQTPAPNPEEAAKLKQLGRLEQRVREYKTAWLPAGQALAEISDGKLWALRGAPNFARFVKGCDVSPRHAGDLMRGAKIAENVRNVSHQLTLRAILELGRIESPEDQAVCLSEIIRSAAGRRDPTAKQVRQGVDARIGPRKKRKERGLIRLNFASGTLTIKPSGVIVLKPKNRGIDRRTLVQEALAKLSSPPQADAA